MTCQANHLSQFTILATRSDDRSWVLVTVALLDLLFVGCFITAFILDTSLKKDIHNPSPQLSNNTEGNNTSRDHNSSFFESEINSEAQQKLYNLMKKQQKKRYYNDNSMQLEHISENEESDDLDVLIE